MARRRARSEKGAVRARVVLAVVLIVSAALAWSVLSRGTDAGTGAATSGSDGYPAPRSAVVERVVDGDTIVVRLDGTSERVRLLNIDTPESVAPGRPVECLGPEASAYLTDLLPVGTPVTLEFDDELRDRYDRLLAGVVTSNGALVNAEIARAGYADPLVVGGNDRFAPDVDAAVAEAQHAAIGLWAPGGCG